MSHPPLRRPVFILTDNQVGGGPVLFLRRAESARRLGLDPVVVTVPGPMDSAYRRTARLIHVDAALPVGGGPSRRVAERLADEVAALLGPLPSTVEAAIQPDIHWAAIIAARLPESDYLFYAVNPDAAPRGAPPLLRDLRGDPAHFRRALAGRGFFRRELGALADAGRLLAVNSVCAEDLARQVGRPDLPVVLHPAVVGARSEPRRRDPDPFLLSVSRLDGASKAYVRGLVESLPGLRRDCPGLRLTVVGDGPDRPVLEARVRALGLDSAVTFLGALENAALGPLYASCAVFVGMGTSACEAALCGAPVVLTQLYRADGASPGYFGDPAIRGFGEQAEGQPLRPAAEFIAPLLADPAWAEQVGGRGRGLSLADHHPDSLDRRLRELLSSPRARVPAWPHPWPSLPRFLRSFSAGSTPPPALARLA